MTRLSGLMVAEITFLLQRVGQGDRQAADELFRLVEAELRVIASKRRDGFRAEVDAPVTLLVNEAYMRLLGPDNSSHATPADRKEFFRFAATKIHYLLVEITRREMAVKRGGGQVRVSPEGIDVGDHTLSHSQLLIDLESALEKFDHFAPDDALVFRVRYFLDCTFEETAAVVGISPTEAKRSFARTKLWLKTQLRSYLDDDDA